MLSALTYLNIFKLEFQMSLFKDNKTKFYNSCYWIPKGNLKNQLYAFQRYEKNIWINKAYICRNGNISFIWFRSKLTLHLRIVLFIFIYHVSNDINQVYIIVYWTTKQTLKILGPRTWCRKNFLVIVSHTTWIPFSLLVQV